MRRSADQLLLLALGGLLLLASALPATAADRAHQAWLAVVTPAAPEPHLVESRAKPTRQSKTELLAFASAPFPYHGTVPGTDEPFLNVEENGRLGHRSGRGNVHWNDQTYSDPRVLLHIPKGFDIRRPGLIVLFFHGHGATLERDVLHRQRVADQVSRSGANAVLVAPQLAFDAADSSAGKLWESGGCRQLLAEASKRLAQMLASPKAERSFASMPVVIVAYSGGFLPTASCLQRGGLNARVRGVVLLDGLYGDTAVFERWLLSDRSAFFISSYTGSTAGNNLRLRQILEQNTVATSDNLQPRLAKGSVAFLATANVSHRDFVTAAWTEHPLADVLKRAGAFAR